jgi:hypothetical protein
MIFILIFLCGFVLAYTLSNKLTLLEKTSLALPLGFGVASFVMFKSELFLHQITLPLLQTGLVATILGCIGILAFMHLKGIRKIEKPSFKIDLSWFSLPWAVFAGTIAYLAMGITKKCLYWPVAEFDTIQGYDLLSKAIAHEGRLANSILANVDIVAGCGPRLLYPPLLSMSNAICYMTGMESPRIINTLFFISWIFLFYALLRRFVKPLGAIFFTFLMVITPEMFAHASFSLTNYPCAIYTSAAVMFFVHWYKERTIGILPLSAFLMACGLWTRSDVVMVNGALLLVAAYIFFKEKKWQPLVLFLASLSVFFIWTFYSKAVIPRAASSFFITHLFFDFEKLSTVLSTAWGMLTNTQTYGLTFLLFFIALLVNIKAIIQKDQWLLLFVLLVGWGGYTLLYYQMDNTDGTLFSNGGWMLSGYKRGVFVYAPLCLFYVATSKYGSWLFDKLDDMVSFGKK